MNSSDVENMSSTELKREIQQFINGPISLKEIIREILRYKYDERDGKLLRVPVSIGSTVYVIAKCNDIEQVLDGPLNTIHGDPGAATGYYCPYEEDCPLCNEDGDCIEDQNKKAVFKDTVEGIEISNMGTFIRTKFCSHDGQLGYSVFDTKEEAEQHLQNMQEMNLF